LTNEENDMTSTQPAWETIEVPRGAYIGWGNKPPQTVTAKVLSFSMTGGTDANGLACPQLGLELLEGADSYRERGTIKERLNAGELVVVNASQVSLRRGVIAAQPAPGDLIKLAFTNTVKVDKGEVKEFEVQIARGAGGDAAPGIVAANGQPTRAEPPF
jgi:hypothetical protein